MNPSGIFPETRMTDNSENENSEKAGGSDPLVFSISEFLSLLGHELRTPLAGTMGMLDLVLAGDLAPDQRSALELAGASARIMLRLIEDLHDLARMQAGRLELQSGPFEVRPWCRNLEQEMIGGDVKYHVDVDPLVPEILVGDGERIAHLILSLVDLYLKQSRPDRLYVRLMLESCMQGDFLFVTLGREDARLSERERDALLQSCKVESFVPLSAFRQVGLRQAVASNLTAILGGALWPAQSSDISGFQSLAVPVQVPTAYKVTDTSPGVAETLSGMESASSEVHILLVEDDDAIRRLVELLLEQRGWRVTAVTDGLQALEALQAHRFDLVLMDVRMPRMDGLETTRRIRHREESASAPPLPIIGMTAHAAMQDRTMCLEAGMDDHLSKPIASERLYRAIEEYLAGGR